MEGHAAACVRSPQFFPPCCVWDTPTWVHAIARPKRFGSLLHGMAAGLNVPCLGTLVAIHPKAGALCSLCALSVLSRSGYHCVALSLAARHVVLAPCARRE